MFHHLTLSRCLTRTKLLRQARLLSLKSHLMADTFRYRTLNAQNDEIRLLRTKLNGESNPGTVIEYELETIKLPRYGEGKVPKYYAVSYVWGDELQRTCIMINGMKLTVPLNTAQALGSVRMGLSQLRTQSDQSEEARIWIDAVCINQADHKERAEQVFKMKDIYENAAAVIICLGEHASPDEAEAALGSVHDIYETAMHWYGGAVSPLADTNSIAGMLSATHPSDEDYRYDLFSSVAAVFKSPWFERLWTIQESGFARKAWCILGSGVIPLYEIGVVANVMTTPLYNNMSEALRDIAHGLELANAREKFRSLESSGLFFPAIKTFMGYSASDPRDMVYAVLSLIRQNCYPVPTVVDYTCSVQELFARVTVQSIILSQSLEPLQIAALQSEDGTNDGFPSWAMRLDRGKKMTLDPLRPQFEASMSGGPWVRGIHEMPLLTRWKTLRLEGAILDEVAYAQQLDCHPNFADIRFIDSIFSIHSAISDADAAKATESSGNHPGSSQLAIKLPFWQWPETEPWNDLLVNSVARTLAAGLYADNENRVQLNVKYIENGQRYLSEYRDKRALIEPSCIYGSVCKKMGLSFPKTKSFQRAFFITKEGRLGLGPLGTIPGDQVSVFCGGHVPFVLRQKEESWRLVGDAYVHDLDHDQHWSDLAKHVPAKRNLRAYDGGIYKYLVPVFEENSEASGNSSIGKPGNPVMQMRYFDIE